MKGISAATLFFVCLTSAINFFPANVYCQKKEVFIPSSSRQVIHGRVVDEKGDPIIAQVQAWYYPLTPLVIKYDNRPVTGRTDNLITISYTNDQGYFSIRVPADTINLIVSKGPEWSYVKKSFIIKEKAFGGIEINIILKRLYDLTKLGWYGGDVHHHSIYSDGYQTPSEVAVAMKGVGLYWGILTDHNSDTGIEEWLATKSFDFIPIHGCEITTEPSDNSIENGYGHLNQSFIEKINGMNTNNPNIWARAIFNDHGDVQAMIDSTHSQNGFIAINHPYQNWDWSGRFKSWGKVKNFDAIEVWNGEPPFSTTVNVWDTNKININTYALQTWFEYLDAGNRLPGIAGSDCHDISGKNAYPKGEFYWTTTTGNPRTYVHVKNFSRDSIKESLINGNSFLTSSFGPILIMTINDKIAGDIVKVPENGEVDINLKVLANQPLLKSSDALKVIFNGKIVKEIATDSTLTFMKSFSFETNKDGWIISEIFGPYPMYSITNPVYLDYPPYGDNVKSYFTDPKDAIQWDQFPAHPKILLPDGPTSWRDSYDSKINISK